MRHHFDLIIRLIHILYNVAPTYYSYTATQTASLTDLSMYIF